MKLDTLYQWTDESPRDCPFQMALDEALFHFTQSQQIGVLRFYSWKTEALTFGYSEPHPGDQWPGAVRRYTGGGRVEHGEDLTFLLTLPAESLAARQGAAQRYHWIHDSLRMALARAGYQLDSVEERPQSPTGPCFEAPVSSDLLSPETGEKIVGGAQRRSRGSVIHQGSLRLPSSLRENHSAWSGPFAQELSKEILPFPSKDCNRVREEAEHLARERYGSDSWNRKR